MFQMAFVYQLPWRSENSSGGIARTLINDWQINGIFGAFSGSPFTVTADGTDAEYAGQPADGRSGRAGECRSATSAPPASTMDPSAWAQPEGVRFGNTPAEPVPRPGRLEPRPVGLPFVPSDRRRTASRRAWKRPTSPTRRNSAIRRAASRAAISCASSACTARMRNGRSGWRFATASRPTETFREHEPGTSDSSGVMIMVVAQHERARARHEGDDGAGGASTGAAVRGCRHQDPDPRRSTPSAAS